MKFALAQINPTVGDIYGNTQNIIQTIVKYGKDIDVLVFPEMVITGYPPQDLLFEPSFLKDTQTALLEIAQMVHECTVIVGTVRQENKSLFNSAAVIHKDGVVEFRDKTLLPTYDVFEEKRYFSPSENIEPVPVSYTHLTLPTKA